MKTLKRSSGGKWFLAIGGGFGSALGMMVLRMFDARLGAMGELSAPMAFVRSLCSIGNIACAFAMMWAFYLVYERGGFGAHGRGRKLLGAALIVGLFGLAMLVFQRVIASPADLALMARARCG